MLKDEDASVITFGLIIIAYLLPIRNLKCLNLPLSHVSKHASPRMQMLGFYNIYRVFILCYTAFENNSIPNHPI